jgi:hypothetical protein
MTRSRPSHAAVEIPIGAKDAKPQIVSELTPEELQAIGLITVQWAHLEHCLHFRSVQLAVVANVAEPKHLLSVSFTRRLRAFRELACKLSSPAKEKWKRIVDRIANAEGDRHKVTHGLWIWESAQDNDLVAVASFRAPHKYEPHFNLPRLSLLAERINELLFELSFPEGELEALMTAVPIRPRGKSKVERP